MVAYYQVVRDLEDKFHRLELHHVMRDYNKATDVLAKTASSRKPVPHGVFASDQRVPYVRVEGEKPPEVEELEVMAIDQPPELNLEDPDWWSQSSSGLSKGSFPLNRRRLDASHGERRRSSSSRASSTSEELLTYSCGASSGIKAMSFYERSTRAHAVISQAQEHL
jgi:hypothetical protein